MARWLEVLSTYDFNIQHRPGRLHGNADGLSRRPCVPCEHCNRQEIKAAEQNAKPTVRAITRQQVSAKNNATNNSFQPGWVQHKTKEELREAQLNDPVISQVIDLKARHDTKPKWEDISPACPELKAY